MAQIDTNNVASIGGFAGDIMIDVTPAEVVPCNWYEAQERLLNKIRKEHHRRVKPPVYRATKQRTYYTGPRSLSKIRVYSQRSKEICNRLFEMYDLPF